ncbi:hypothetical protein [Selenomonas ruminantium]|uniref:hypothetical protein n=1 Tax=Selenomonas ruminantium TaxID=971 RepID=UPI0026EB8307|nr:hypothetical protein [Selenomonas ruminantium]
MRGCALRVFPTGPSRGLPAQRAFQPVLVSVPLYTAAGASCIYLGRLGLDGQASVHEGSRGIELFDEYNKGS